MVEFLHYCWQVLYFAFSGAWAVANSVSFIVAILGGIIAWKYPPKEPIMKNLAWIVPLGVFVVFLIISLAIVAPYKIYKNQEQKINELQNNLAVAQRQIRGADTTKTDIKQDIRTFLESLNPEILAKVDARVKEVGVWLGPVNQVKLTSLSDRPEFSKFLSFKKTEHVWMVAGEGKLGDFIRPIGETGTLVGYYLYPKDALIK